MGMVGWQETVRSIHELIRVSQKEQEVLMTFVAARPAESSWVLESIKFRDRVLEEFNRLAARAEYAERIAAAEAEDARRGTAAIPPLPLLHELIVTA